MTDSSMPNQPDSLIQLEMVDGRLIWCWQYLATCTYASFPIRETSQEAREYLQRHIEHEARTLFGEGPLHLILPEDDGHEFPPFRFLGQFTSAPVADKDVSALNIAWFQTLPQPALDEETRQTIQMLDWTALSVDIEW